MSPYLAGVLRSGASSSSADRGSAGTSPGAYGDGGPLLLVAGGSGLVPLMAMLRHRANQGSELFDARLLVSVRMRGDLLYADELAHLSGTPGLAVHTDAHARAARRLGRASRAGSTIGMLAAVGPSPASGPRIFVCGPTPFVEAAADLLVDLGHEPAAIHAERFGPTGG